MNELDLTPYERDCLDRGLARIYKGRLIPVMQGGAAYTPKTLVEATALTASAVTYYDPSSVVGIMRTIQFSASAASKTVTLSNGTDAAGTRIFDALALTANVPAIYNGWWTVSDNKVVQAKASDTVPVLFVGGLEYA